MAFCKTPVKRGSQYFRAVPGGLCNKLCKVGIGPLGWTRNSACTLAQCFFRVSQCSRSLSTARNAICTSCRLDKYFIGFQKPIRPPLSGGYGQNGKTKSSFMTPL